MIKRISVLSIIVLCLFATSSFANEFSNIYIRNGIQVYSSEYSRSDDFKTIIPGSLNEYIDYSHGYSISYPNHMWVDVTLSDVRTVIADKDTRIEIYYDDFEGTIHSANSYLNYSSRFKYNTKDHKIEKDQMINVNGMRTHLLKWNREKITNIDNDKNYYVNAKIVRNQREVFTIFIKSSKPINNYMEIINSFKLVTKRTTPRINTSFKLLEHDRFNEETTDFYNNYFLESEKLKWGIFEWTASTNYDQLNKLEERLDYPFEFLVRYQTLKTNFPMKEMQRAYENNKYVELTLQTKYNHHSDTDNPSITYELLQGKYDEFLIKYAQDMKEFGHPVLFRLNNEMNGDWCIYSSYFTSNDTELFKAKWRYIYNIFKEHGVDNAIWVWNPHDGSFPGFKWNHYLTYYPGDEYVDVIGLTGYNPGTHFKGESWKEFNEIYPHLYEEYAALFQQPLMITEFGASSIGGDKIQWIKDMFDSIDQFERIKVAIWWNGIDYDENGNPGRIYRLDETEEMLDVFRSEFSKYKKIVDEIVEID